MKINHNGIDYRIRITYRHGKKIGGKALANLKGRRIVTEAIVQKRFRDGDWMEVAKGQSIRNKLDAFDKAEGRRRAIQRAFVKSDNNPGVDEDVRALLWQEYARLHRDGNLIQTEKPVS